VLLFSGQTLPFPRKGTETSHIKGSLQSEQEIHKEDVD
jgi:hypothetical protein